MSHDWTLARAFFTHAEALADRTFVTTHRFRPSYATSEVTWKEMRVLVERAAHGFEMLGFRRGDRVALMAENHLEWLVVELATAMAGIVSVIVQPNLSDLTISNILADAGARAVVCDDSLALRVLGLRPSVPSLERVVAFGATAPERAVAFDELLRLGATGTAARTHEMLDEGTYDSIATILYTSGSTGRPKGVIKTQRNLVYGWLEPGGGLPSAHPDETLGVVLSLSHQLGRNHTHRAILCGRGLAMTDLAEHELDVGKVARMAPAKLVVVPRLLVRLWNEIVENEAFRMAFERLQQSAVPDGQLRRELRSQLVSSLGGRLVQVHSGGAPTPPAIIAAFRLLQLELLTGYGMTECGHIFSSPIGAPIGAGGAPDHCTEIRLANDGEILVRGHSVTPGYWQNEVATREALDDERWFHTGDFGVRDPDGSYRIVGRKKDMFTCSEGSNVYPGWIESALEADPVIKQAVLVGDRRAFIGVFVVPQRQAIAARAGKSEAELGEREIQAAIAPRIEEMNTRLESYEKIRRFEVLQEDLPEDVRSKIGVIGKIQVDRKRFATLYGDAIERMYAP